MSENDDKTAGLEQNDYELMHSDIRAAFGLDDDVDPVEVAQIAVWHLIEIYRRRGHRRLVFVELADQDGLYGIMSVEELERAKAYIAEREENPPPLPEEMTQKIKKMH